MSDRTNNILDEMEHSKTQERLAICHVSDVFHKAGILPDEATKTKKQGMDENRANGAKTSHEVHNGTSVSWNTYHTYQAACVPLAVYAHQEFGIRDVRQITPDTVASYLNFAIDCEVKASTFDKNCSAIEKFCDCINTQTGKGLDFHSTIDEIRHSAKDMLPTPEFTTRAYDNPTAIIEQLPPNMQIAAELQLYCGLRVSDACYISPNEWNGVTLTMNKSMNGQSIVLTVENSKNGQDVPIKIPADLASRLSAVIEAEGKFSVNRNSYDYQLEKACNAVGQEFHGSHGLRHNFAQNQMAEYTSRGMSFNDALQHVSEDMGHHRPDITKHYLR